MNGGNRGYFVKGGETGGKGHSQLRLNRYDPLRDWGSWPPLVVGVHHNWLHKRSHKSGFIINPRIPVCYIYLHIP